MRNTLAHDTLKLAMRRSITSEFKPAPLAEIWIAPAAIAAAFIAAIVLGPRSPIPWLAGMVFHEAGHALIYWLSSTVAIPVFALTLPLQQSRSAFTFALLIAAFAWLAYRSKSKGRRELLALSIFAALVVTLFTFVLSEKSVEQVMLYGGLGGEMYLGALATLLFYAQLPTRFNWRRNRFLFLIAGALSYAAGAVQWISINRGGSELPRGALLDFGALSDGQSSGDLDRLAREFNWSEKMISSSYLYTFLITTVLLAIAWALIARYRVLNPISEASRGTDLPDTLSR